MARRHDPPSAARHESFHLSKAPHEPGVALFLKALDLIAHEAQFAPDLPCEISDNLEHGRASSRLRRQNPGESRAHRVLKISDGISTERSSDRTEKRGIAYEKRARPRDPRHRKGGIDLRRFSIGDNFDVLVGSRELTSQAVHVGGRPAYVGGEDASGENHFHGLTMRMPIKVGDMLPRERFVAPGTIT